MSLPLEKYALIGDCETAALVSSAGSIDWLCWPRFDSAACFAAIVGSSDNGRWLIEAVDPNPRVTRCYRDRTLVLETTIATAEGTVTVIDFMPPHDHNSHLVRIVRGDSGRVRLRMELVLRFDYGRTVPWVSRLPDGTWRAIAGPDTVILRTPVDLRGEDLKTVAEFEVTKGETVPFVLTHRVSHREPPKATKAESLLHGTEKFWTEWVSRIRPNGEWAEAVIRSLITLKALVYAPTGGMVASPTTSLPEHLGGVRNWDYRFCWLRDATLTLLSFINSGYHDEAAAWRDWLLRAAAGSPSQLQIMYGLAGERRLTEEEIPWLSGYESSRPVRIGNAAHAQLQLDVYGEVLDVLHQARTQGLVPSEADWPFQRELLEHLESVWQQPDASIWEVRGELQQFTYSKIMAWVAFDRGIKAIEGGGVKGPLDRWRTVRAAIHDEVCTQAFDRSRGCFVQSYGSKALDASLLLMPTTGFLSCSDPRVRRTIEAIEQHLVVDGFVRRYDTGTVDDGLPAGEGVFLACSFWLADAYVLMGRMDDARRLFERMLSLRNDVGLLAEEYDTRAARLIGNFPQAYSHVALITTAHNLARTTKPAEQRARS